MSSNTEPVVSQETREIRFMTGTWYTLTIPAEKIDQPGYSPEELYSSYWGEGLPEDVDISEDEVDHIWEGDDW